MHPILFKFGSLTISSYSFITAFGFLLAVFIAILRARKVGISIRNVIDLSLYVLISGFLGARLFHKFQHISFYNSISDFLNIWKGGFAYYGGFVFAFSVGIIYILLKKLPTGKIVDIIAPSLAIGEGIGRIGCFLAGCCFGKPTDLSCGVIYPKNSFTWSIIGSQAVYPTQVYSAITLFCIFVILLVIQKYMKFHGQLFLTFLIFHSLYRFIIDFFRYYTPEEHIIMLTTSQFISIIIALGAVISMFIIMKKRLIRSSIIL